MYPVQQTDDIRRDDRPGDGQFSLRTIFAVVWVAAVFLAVWRIYSQGVFWFAVPFGIAGAQLINSGQFWGRMHQQYSALWRIANVIPVLIALAMCVLIPYKHGAPWNAAAWFLLVNCFVWTVFLATKFCGPWMLVQLIPLFILWSSLTTPSWPAWGGSCADIRAGRHGMRLFAGATFARDGRNTSTIESYLGPQPPEWRGIGGHGDQFAKYHLLVVDTRWDYVEHADLTELRNVLMVLPTEESRRQVVRCLTDPDNLLRAHQGLLLAFLYARGYPRSYADEDPAKQWWNEYGKYFYQEHDAKQAVALVYGWANSVPLNLVETPLGTEQGAKYSLLYQQQQLAAFQERSYGDRKFAEQLDRLWVANGYKLPPEKPFQHWW
jgi:hypothetical protein